MRRFALAATLYLLAAPLYAAAPAYQMPGTSLEGIPGGKYDIEPTHTSVSFSVNHLGFSYYTGRFNTVEGTLMLDPANPERSAAKITVEIESVDTGNTHLEEKLQEQPWFDSYNFPDATFTSTSLKRTSETTGEMRGELRLRGVSRPLTLQVTFNGAGINPINQLPTLGFSATGSFKRSAYGLKEYLGMVGDEVTLRIEAEFNQPKDAKK